MSTASGSARPTAGRRGWNREVEEPPAPSTSTSDSKSDDGGRFLDRDALLLAAVVVVGITGTGVVRRLLGEAGLNDLGAVVWLLGYGGTVLVVRYGWVRPLDVVGPSRRLEDVEDEQTQC